MKPEKQIKQGVLWVWFIGAQNLWVYMSHFPRIDLPPEWPFLHLRLLRPGVRLDQGNPHLRRVLLPYQWPWPVRTRKECHLHPVEQRGLWIQAHTGRWRDKAQASSACEDWLRLSFHCNERRWLPHPSGLGGHVLCLDQSRPLMRVWLPTCHGHHLPHWSPALGCQGPALHLPPAGHVAHETHPWISIMLSAVSFSLH